MSASASSSNVDLDALLDLSEYDNNHYNSPSLSPTPTAKAAAYSSPISVSVPTPGLPASTPQALSGPSHKYDLYRQQTGFVPGAIANTMAVNQSINAGYQDFGSLAYLSTLSEDQVFNFNTSPSQPSMDLDFEPAADSLFNTVNPSNIENDGGSSLASPASTSGSVGRLWPGAHSQAALAKAQAQQRQPQQRAVAPQKSRVKPPHPTDPLVEQKIAQVLNSMRATPSAPEPSGQAVHASLPRSRKEEDDMDEDERLLASEEGKKLSSKERRQLRNKVSARAFRSRRKEYISQLEAEISTKVNENGDLRSQNRALMEENKRLADLSRMLLSSPSFSNFLDHLSTDPQATQVKMEPQQQAQPQAQSHVPKDVNPHSGQQQIGMAMIPEQSMDMSILSLDSAAAYNFQPQVFVVDTPEVPATVVDVSVLSGKAGGDLVEETVQSEEDGKVAVAAMERPDESPEAEEAVSGAAMDDEFERDPDYALFHSEPAPSVHYPEHVDEDCPDISTGTHLREAPSRSNHVDAEPEEVAAQAVARVKRIRAELESLVSRLELLTADL
ncbi:hypothetical protein XA68_11468 [Ophiocordyceps unilateralis]|uniref:BZIP domain-containing protein n=1 Tax=Ophiocordyceps unilateralis TaxID=268505 RepID=A0A2A9PGT4_OPHUN|nr:hypothetical protein XA68_11468 [Ophiocordyceps unilateralis]